MADTRESLQAEIKRRGGAAKAPGFAAKLAAIEQQHRQAAAPAPAAPAEEDGQMHTGGSATFNEETGQQEPAPAPAAPAAPAADFGALKNDRRALEAQRNNAKQGSDRQLKFSNQLAAKRNEIQAAKTAAGQSLSRPTGVTGQQMVNTLGKRAEQAQQPSQPSQPRGQSMVDEPTRVGGTNGGQREVSGVKATDRASSRRYGTPGPEFNAQGNRIKRSAAYDQREVAAGRQSTMSTQGGRVGGNFNTDGTDEELAAKFNRAQGRFNNQNQRAPNAAARMKAIQDEQARRNAAKNPADPNAGGGEQEEPITIDNGGKPPPADTAPPSTGAPGAGTPPATGAPGAGGPPPGEGGGGGSPYYGGYGDYNLPGMYSSGSGQMRPDAMPSYRYQETGGQPQTSAGLQAPGGDQNSPGGSSGFNEDTGQYDGQRPQTMQMQGGQMTPSSQAGDIYKRATGGTISQFDTAANRLRERLDAQTEGLLETQRNRNVGRGFGNSGAQDADAFRINQASQTAYGEGLNGLSQQFEQLRQEGLKTGLGAANAGMQNDQARNQLGQLDLSQMRGLNNSNYQFGAGQNQQNRQFMDSTLFNMINNREGRGSAERISGNEQAAAAARQAANNQFQGGENALNRQSQAELAAKGYKFEGGQNDQNRQMQEMIAQLQQQGSNWRSSLDGLFGGGGSSPVGGSSGYGGTPFPTAGGRRPPIG